MAAFKVLQPFRIAQDAQVRFLSPGAIYLVGDTITGLIAAEANELLALAPDGTFEPADAEAETVADRRAAKQTEAAATDTEATHGLRVGGTTQAGGKVRTTKGGA